MKEKMLMNDKLKIKRFRLLKVKYRKIREKYTSF